MKLKSSKHATRICLHSIFSNIPLLINEEDRRTIRTYVTSNNKKIIYQLQLNNLLALKKEGLLPQTINNMRVPDILQGKCPKDSTPLAFLPLRSYKRRLKIEKKLQITTSSFKNHLLKMMISTHFCSLSDANQKIAELKDHGTILKFKSTINHFLNETKQAITDHELAKHARKKEKILSLSSNSNNNNDSNTITTTNSSSQHSTPPPPGTIPDHEPLLPATQHPGVLCLVENEQLNTVIPLLDKGRNFKVTPTSKKDLIQVTEIGVQRLIAGMKYANPAWRERENENIPTSPTPTYDTDPLYGPTSKLDRDLNPPARPTANIAAQIAKLKVNMKPILNKLAFSSLSPNTDPEQLQCLKELAKDPSIHLGLSDKTNKIIAIDPVIVREQTLKHLQNRSLFREVDRDPSEQIEKGGNDLLNSILPSLNRASKEGKKIYKRLYTYDTRAPIIQPLLKDHKPDFPNCNIRPVQPVTNSAVEKIDLTVSQVLTQITPLLPYRAKDTAAFKTRLRSLPRPPQGSFMVSLDIVNMYPSMPTDEKALEIIEDYLETYHDVINLFGFTTTNIVDLLRFVLHNTYISYNGRYFIQESGVGTGNRSSGAYSEILVDWTYQQAMMVAPNEPVGLTCYVDDAWMLWYGSLTEFQGFKDALNAIWPTVKFQEEMEENGMINFLDLTITRNEEGIKYTFYQKITNSGRYLHFSSHCAMSTKTNIVKSEAR